MTGIIGQPHPPSDDRVMEEWSAADADPQDGAVVVEELTIAPQWHEARLDKVLAAMLAGWSRSHLSQVIEAGDVRWLKHPDRPLKPSHKVRSGEVYRVTLHPLASSAAFEPQAMDLTVLHEDEHLMVIDKPAGLVVHPAPGHWSGTLLNALLHHHAGARALPRAGIVHRLDKDTSGLMMVGKTPSAVDALVQAIGARSVRREYLALAHKPWRGKTHIEIQTDMGRDPRNRLRMAALPEGKGKWSQTDVTCLATNDQASWVHCRLHSGRTHQIRVHMAHLGHPLVSDVTYGGQLLDGLNRQALHAWRLSLAHPHTGQALQWTCPPPPDLRQALSQVGLGYNERLLPVP
ncbi:MAG: hypothetical protein RL111_733 [Pseudomonadota bacterium]|jgi:23S rRNA pseudouridine1911/1915/1917 synthase